MTKPKILLQIDPDSQPSSFDSIVAIDSDIDQLLVYSNVSTEDIESLVHGAIFTRGPRDLKSTAIFFGGSNVDQTESLVDGAKRCFFGPMRVSIMSDPNGSNTTAAAAVASVENQIDLAGKTITILAGTGPVGIRLSQILAGPAQLSAPPTIRVCSRRLEKAKKICEQIQNDANAELIPTQTATPEDSIAAVSGSDVVFAAGAAGIELVPTRWQELADRPRVAVDLNAVAPAGIPGVDMMDAGVEKNETVCFGAIGIGTLKMKLHQRAIRLLFESNENILELEQIYQLARTIS